MLLSGPLSLWVESQELKRLRNKKRTSATKNFTTPPWVYGLLTFNLIKLEIMISNIVTEITGGY